MHRRSDRADERRRCPRDARPRYGETRTVGIILARRAIAGGRIEIERRGGADFGAVGDARAHGRGDGAADRQGPRRPRRDAPHGPHARRAVIAAETRRAREVEPCGQIVLHRHAGRGQRRPARIGDAQHIVDARPERRGGVADRFGQRKVGIARRHAGEVKVGAHEIAVVGRRILVANLEPPGPGAVLAVESRQRRIGAEDILIGRRAVRMIGAIAVGIDRLRRVVVEADVEIIAVDAASIAVDELDARSGGRLQRDAQVAAPAVRREQAKIDVADDMAGADGEIAHERRGAGGRGVDRARGGVAVGRGGLRDGGIGGKRKRQPDEHDTGSRRLQTLAPQPAVSALVPPLHGGAMGAGWLISG